MSYVVSQDLIGRHVVAKHDFYSGRFPWAWNYNPGPRGAKILAVYAMQSTRDERAIVTFLIEGTEVVLETNALGGGSSPRTRIDEILAQECVLLERETVQVQASTDSMCAARCGAAATSAGTLGWAGLEDRIGRKLDLCDQCREGVGRCVEYDHAAYDGTDAIREERERQLKKWAREHDLEEHRKGELVDAAIGLLGYPDGTGTAGDARVARARWELATEKWIRDLADKHADRRVPDDMTGLQEAAPEKAARLRLLAIAGAFVAAEIDRLREQARRDLA